MKILIIRLSAIGDVIHVLPSLYLLRKYFSNDFIGWAVQKKSSELLINHPLINRVYVLDNNIYNWFKCNKIINELKNKQWDIIIDFHNIFKSIILRYLLNGSIYTFPYYLARNIENKIGSILPAKTTKIESNNVVQRSIYLTKYVIENTLKINIYNVDLKIKNMSHNFSFENNKQNEKKVLRWMITNNLKKFIIISPNSSKKEKCLPILNWIEILSNININIVIIGKHFGNQAFELCETLDNTNNKFKYIVAPDFNLKQLIYLIKKSLFVISPDSCVLHITSFLNKQGIGLFGPTSKKFFSNYYNGFTNKNSIQIPIKHNLNKFSNFSDPDCMSYLDTKKLVSLVKDKLTQIIG